MWIAAFELLKASFEHQKASSCSAGNNSVGEFNSAGSISSTCSAKPVRATYTQPRGTSMTAGVDLPESRGNTGCRFHPFNSQEG